MPAGADRRPPALRILLGIPLTGDGVGFDILESEGVSLEHVQTGMASILPEQQAGTQETASQRGTEEDANGDSQSTT